MSKTIKPENIFRALSDKTRLRILHILLGGELCVCDIVNALQVPQPTASRHLAYLRKSGLVVVRKDGIWSYYKIAESESDFDTSLRSCIKACGSLPRLMKDKAQLGKCKSECCE